MKYLAILMLYFALSLSAHASKLVGEATFSWLFWDIYHIKLWTTDGSYSPELSPLRLEIQYLRDIEKNQLIETTIDQWQQQNLSWKQDWINDLQKIWPDIQEHDTLILQIDDNLHSHFYFNKELLGSIEDPQFSQTFSDIWLSPNSTQPELRNVITGGAKNA